MAGASHNECCFNCKANKSDVPYNDFRPAAAWRKTIVRHKDKTPTSHPLKKIPGVNGHSFHYDTLHNLEEGVPAHAVGNAMFDLVCRTGGFPGTQEEALQTLYKKIAQQYVEQGIESSNRIKRLTFSSFCNAKSKFDNFPVLSGFQSQAHQVAGELHGSNPSGVCGGGGPLHQAQTAGDGELGGNV